MARYYEETNYTPESFERKKKIVEDFLDVMKPKTVWDLGANTGIFSRLASRRESDRCVRRRHRRRRAELPRMSGEKRKKPSPPGHGPDQPDTALGWRTGKDVPAGARAGRCGSGPGSSPPPGDLQQPAFSKNRRFPGPDLPQPGHRIRPKTDSQVQRLLATREDIFGHYTQPDFEEQFGRVF